MGMACFGFSPSLPSVLEGQERFGVRFRNAFPVLGGLLLFFFGYRASSVLLTADLHARLPDWIRATYPSVLSTVLRVGLVLVYPLLG
ncbi:MAG: hypothetical protein GX493_01500, partial [Firmicutes bacterium]|nr:hypothetical protein [Bacillota bacterium]